MIMIKRREDRTNKKRKRKRKIKLFKKRKESTSHNIYNSDMFIKTKSDLKLIKQCHNPRSSVSPFHIVADAYLKECQP